MRWKRRVLGKAVEKALPRVQILDEVCGQLARARRALVEHVADRELLRCALFRPLEAVQTSPPPDDERALANLRDAEHVRGELVIVDVVARLLQSLLDLLPRS